MQSQEVFRSLFFLLLQENETISGPQEITQVLENPCGMREKTSSGSFLSPIDDVKDNRCSKTKGLQQEVIGLYWQGGQLHLRCREIGQHRVTHITLQSILSAHNWLWASFWQKEQLQEE